MPSDGTGTPVRLNMPLVAGGDVRWFQLHEDTVVFLADAFVDNMSELFAVPADGSSPPVQLSAGANAPLTEWRTTADGQRVVYRGGSGAVELWSAPLDASAAPTRINAPLVAGGNV